MSPSRARPGRRAWLASALGAGCAALAWPELNLLAREVGDFIEGPPVADIRPQQISTHVWMIHAPDGFPTPENRGMMANISFVVSSAGVIVLDSGASLQIGRMALRMIKRVTDKPVVAVFNSHYHGDHWLGNHAFVEAHGEALPIHALAHTAEQIRSAEGRLWLGLMERWTNQSSAGTRIVAPNRIVQDGQQMRFGDVTLRLHHFGQAHTPSDLCVEVVEDRVTVIGDIAMGNRIANMDDGSYPGTLKYYAGLRQRVGQQIWVPGHGQPARDLLERYGAFLSGIWEPCLKAVQQGWSEGQARAMVLADPRVSSRAATMQGFDSNIGKYISLAYIEAEKEAF